MSEWVSVNDKLPEDNQLVMLYTKNPYGDDDIIIGYRGRHKLFCNTFSVYEWLAQIPMSSSQYVIDTRGNDYLKPREVTHWMPLPEPPK